jgi:hypothetical protein
VDDTGHVAPRNSREAELAAALWRLVLMRASAPGGLEAARRMLDPVRLNFQVRRDAPLIRESLRTGRSFGRFGSSAAIWTPAPNAPSLDKALMARLGNPRQRPRERRERRTSRSVGSRGDPSPSDGEPEPPGLTAALPTGGVA